LNDYIKSIRKNSKFTNFSDRELTDFCSYLCEETFKAREVVLKEGESGDKFCIIAAGEIGISKDVNEQVSLFLNNLKEGDFFGEMSLLSNNPRSANAVAATDVTLLCINREKVEQLQKDHPVLYGKFTWVLATTLSERMFRLEERISNILNASLTDNFL
jgi:CRP-like cAMP-binding protein